MDADFPAAHSMDTTWFAVDKEAALAISIPARRARFLSRLCKESRPSRC